MARHAWDLYVVIPVCNSGWRNEKQKFRPMDDISWWRKLLFAYALNLSRGGKIVSLAHQKMTVCYMYSTSSVTMPADFISDAMISDVICRGPQRTKEFKILEFKDVGGEPHHRICDETHYGRLAEYSSHWVFCIRSHVQSPSRFSKMSHKKGAVHFKMQYNIFVILKNLIRRFLLTKTVNMSLKLILC